MLKVIHDGDAAYEDVMALIILALNCELKAVTVAYGEANTEAGAENMARVCRFLKPDAVIPVAFGSNEALSPAGTPFPEFIHKQADQVLQGTDVPLYEDLVIESSAVELLFKTLSESEEKLTIVATGPLTNIAGLLQEHPECREKIDRVVIMGGAVRVPGNISDLIENAQNQVSEWNFFADPLAAKIVLESGLNIQLVPLDLTSQMVMTRTFYESLRSRKEPALKLTFDMLSVLKADINNDDIFFRLHFWDSLTAMTTLDAGLASYEKLAVEVDDLTGQSRETEGLATMEVAMTLLEPEKAYRQYIELLSAPATSRSEYSSFQFYPPSPPRGNTASAPASSYSYT